MLVSSRKNQQSVMVGVVNTVFEIRGGSVSLGVEVNA